MKRVVLALCLTLGVWDAQAWGPLTHAYIAHRIFGDAWPQAIYSATAADMCDMGFFDKRLRPKFKPMTHHESERLALSPFTFGFVTHNQNWGADAWAHAYLDPASDVAYPRVLFEQLSRETGLTVNEAEDCIEITMDYLVRATWGRDLGKTIQQAAASVGRFEERLLVDAYAEELASRIPGMSREEAASSIVRMFRAHRHFIALLGETLTWDETRLRDLWIFVLDGQFDGDAERAKTLFDRSCTLCAGWEARLDEIADTIAAHFAHSVGQRMAEISKPPYRAVLDYLATRCFFTP